MKRVAGILVGGRSSRMNGRPKGLLRAPDGDAIVTRTARLFSAIDARVVLLGSADAYRELSSEALPDEPDAEGPLAGLLALVRHADADVAFLVGCDMPHLTEAFVRALDRAIASAPCVAPRIEARWEPLFAAFRARELRVRIDELVREGVRSPSQLLDALDASPLPIAPEEAHILRDWDTPEDAA